MMNNFLVNNPIWDEWINWGQGDSLSFLYSIFAVTGILATIIASAITMTIRRIPQREFMHSIYMMVPAGLIGGSVFGKMGTNTSILRLFFFWEPGLSIFAALMFGSFVGFLWFNYVKYKNRISLWVYADCIIPHILLGQAIGRWGNLFNHEILGREIDINKFTWLPDFIWQRLFYFFDSSTGEKMTELVYREPLFLYESMAAFSFWIIIVFIVPLIFKFISKKPWKLDELAFPTKKNPLPFEKILVIPTYVEVTYSRKKISTIEGKIESELLYLTKKRIWLKAYYVYELDESVASPLQKEFSRHKETRLIAIKKYSEEKNKMKDILNKEKERFNTKKIEKTDLLNFKQELKKKYQPKLQELKKEKSWWLNIWACNSKEITKLNNPYNLTIQRAGVSTSLYLLFYSLTRFVLDFFRSEFEITLRNAPIANHIMIGLIFSFAATLFVFAQFIAPKKWREEGWLYEKSY